MKGQEAGHADPDPIGTVGGDQVGVTAAWSWKDPAAAFGSVLNFVTIESGSVALPALASASRCSPTMPSAGAGPGRRGCSDDGGSAEMRRVPSPPASSSIGSTL